MTQTKSLLLLIGAVLAMVLAGCGINTDSQPRDINANARINIDLSITPVAKVSRGSERIYLVAPASTDKPTRLRSVTGDFGTTPQSRLTALLAGPTRLQINDRIGTAIPTGTILRSATMHSAGELVVDLTDELLSLSITDLQVALGQIVFTSFEIDDVRSVRIKINGDDHAWPLANGVSTTRPLTTYDYAELLETSQQDFPSLPSE